MSEGSLLQAGGAGKEVGRGRCLLVETFPLPLRVPQFLAVPTNPGTPEGTNKHSASRGKHSQCAHIQTLNPTPLFMHAVFILLL